LFPEPNPVKISAKLATLAAFLALASTGPSHAQAPKAKGAPPAAQTAAPPPAAETPPQPGWSARCSSASRDAPMECAMEQQAVQSKTGQLIALINIRVAGDTHTPVATVQLPLGLNLPGGAKFQVDDGKVVELQIQTCEQRGCFAGGPIAPDLLASMRSGKLLKLSFQNLAKETITIPMPLADFAAAYDKIK
jgi:invasion protein IalB